MVPDRTVTLSVILSGLQRRDPDDPFFPRSSLIWSNYLTYPVRPTKTPKIICCFLSNRLEFLCEILHVNVTILSYNT